MARIQSKRKTPNREYRKTFHVLWEGRNTEREYFEWVAKQASGVIRSIKKPNDNTTSCAGLLKLMKTYLKEHDHDIRNYDEVWIVIDQDNRAERDPFLKELLRWSVPDQKHFVAVSNPRFEYWLLLHFEGANNLSDPQNCCDRLEKCCQQQDYKYELGKKFPSQFYTLEMVNNAVDNAKKRNQRKNEDDPFYTDVYLLVEKILNI